MKAEVRAPTGPGIALEDKVPATVLLVIPTASRVQAAHLPMSDAGAIQANQPLTGESSI